MDVAELKALAKSMGYNIIPSKKYERLLPCLCGCSSREHLYTSIQGMPCITLRCVKCNKAVVGKSEYAARQKWNEMIRGEQNGCNNIKSKDKN